MMERRAFVVGTFGMLATPLAVEAQPAGAQRIGWLAFGGPFLEAAPGLEPTILRALRELGHALGATLLIEYRYAEGRTDRPAPLALVLARLNVDLLLGIGGDIALAFKNATSRIPIVVATSTDPVRAQLVPSLARPGGNLTGVTFIFWHCWSRSSWAGWH